MTLTAPSRGTVRSRRLLPVLLTAQFMALLDTSVVNVAGPTIRSDLDVGGASLQLIIAGYTVVYSMLIITGSRLGGRYGYRRMLTTGLLVFTAASLLCGLAWDGPSLIAFRAVQGAGAALMVPQVLSLVQANFDGPARARAMGSYAAVISGGLVAGQILGGLLASADLFGLSWRPVFLINVPVGIVLYAAAQRVLPPGGSPNARGLDVPGLLLLTPALLALVIPPVMGRELGWPAWGWALLAASAALFAGFVYAERRASAPLLPGALLKLPGVVPAIGTLLLTMAAFSGLMFATALYLQSGLDYSALEAGLTFIPPSAVFATVSLNWQRLPAQWHPRLPAAGIPLAAAGFAATAWAMGTAQPLAVMLAAMTLGSLGMGIAYSPVMNLALRRVPLPQASDASGLLVTVIQVGQVLGIAAFGTLYLSLADDFRWAGEASLLAVAGTLVAAAVPAARLARR